MTGCLTGKKTNLIFKDLRIQRMLLRDPIRSCMRFAGFLAGFTVLLFSCDAPGGKTDLPDVVDYNYHIKPLISDRCFACHGPDEKTREAELSLHTEEGLFAAVDSSSGLFVVAPGDLDASEVYNRIISNDPEYMMPPPESNLTLSDYDKELISKWIQQGAEWKDHWAFIPPVRPEAPAVSDASWRSNPIDAFVLAKMKEMHLKPNPEEDPEKWLRRVYLDLTGLPPGRQTIDEFIEHHSDDRYEAIVDDLLSRPAYGERMASIWLDLARYSDSHGYQDDKPRSIWPWRDWVIKAFNDNKPYDEFVTEQLAGDLLPNASYAQKLATAFNRNHPITQEGGVIDEEYRTEYAADRVQTFATAFLGITLQCARCHDHKYDPISQKEFYELFSFFNSVEGERGQISYFDLAPVPNIQMKDSSYEAYITSVKEHISQLDTRIRQVEEDEKKAFREWDDPEKLIQTIDTTSGLLAYYKLNDDDWQFRDEMTGQDLGRANLNLPPNIARPLKQDGPLGQCVEFNGDNFITLSEIGDFDHWNEFTVSTWVNHSGSLAKDGAIFGRRNEEQYRQGYDCLLLKSRQLAVRLIHNLNAEQIEVKTVDRLPGGWHHLAVTYNGSGTAAGINIFLDGKRMPLTVVRDDLQNLSITNGNDFLIGHWNHRARIVNDQRGFAGGKVDEVRIYKKQLSPLEIRLLAGAGLSDLQNTPFADRFSHYKLRMSSQFRSLKDTRDSLRSIDTRIPEVMIMQEKDTMEPAFVLDRGVYDAKLEPVERNTPAAILTFDQSQKNRLGLAEWLFDERNPLTARVMVNRLWQQCFGTGLVNTAEDFGNQGDLPSHPELLDWLAIEFRDSGWDVKQMLKLILLSRTYRQSSKITSEKLKKDPANRWISRGPHQTLTAEMIRDQALKTSDLLYDKIGGKWVKPYQPAGIWKELANQIGENKYRVSIGRDKYRRSIYTYWKRTIPPPTMLTLDAPERSVCTVKRQATSTPLQALILMNDPTYIEASRHLAQRISEQYKGIREQLQEAYLTIVNRYPETSEMEEMIHFFENIKTDFLNNPVEAESMLAVGDTPATRFANLAEGAALTFSISLIYNLDEAKHR